MSAQAELSYEIIARRAEALRRSAGLLLAPMLFVTILVLPLPGLSTEAQRLAAIFAAVITLWVTEAIPLPVTALLGPTLAVMMNVAGVREAFAPFSDPLMFLFIGSFILARAIVSHGLNERIAYRIMSLPIIAARPNRILVAYGAVAFLLSMWLSNTAATAMLLPIGISLLTFMESSGVVGKAYGTALMLMTTYGASLGGVSTPVGTPANLITLGMIQRFVGIRITFLEWMVIAVPAGVVMLIMAMLYLKLAGRAGGKEIPQHDRMFPSHEMTVGKWTRGERNVVIAFSVTVGLWIVPGLLQLLLGGSHPVAVWLAEAFPESIAAVIGASLLFVLPISRSQRATMTWADASQIDWGTILLLGGGLSLGHMAFNTKLAEVFGTGVANILPATSLITVTFLATILGTLTAEVMSHTAASNIVIPIVISIAQAVGVDPVPPAIAACLGTSIGLMLPVSTPPNAIVFASGRVPITTMIRYGIVVDVFGVVVVPVVVLIMTSIVR